MRVGAADVPVRRLVRSQCVYVTVGTTRTAMKEIVLMTTLPLYSTRELQSIVRFIEIILAASELRLRSRAVSSRSKWVLYSEIAARPRLRLNLKLQRNLS